MTRYRHPSLTLTFLADDLGAQTPRIFEIQAQHIISPSITYQGQLLNGMRPASNQLALTLAASCPAIEAIIVTDGDIHATFKEGDTPVFSGYVSTNHTWTLTERGTEAMRITLEDVGTRLLGKPFLQRGKYLFDCSAAEALAIICDVCSITISGSCPPLSQRIVAVIDDSATCGELLERILFELGHVYYFDALGHLMVYPIDCTTVEDIPILDKEDLCVVGGKALDVSKKIRQYNGAKVSFTRLATAKDYLVYRNTTGSGAAHPYCNMSLDGGHYFDGLEIHAGDTWEEEQALGLRSPALLEACNASGESERVGSSEIISVENVRTVLNAPGGTITASIEAAGGPFLKIEAHNTAPLTHYITRLDAYADVIYVQDTNIVRTTDITAESDRAQNLVTEELTFIHTLVPAQRLANLIGQYHRYAGTTYTFTSERDLSMGAIVRLIDNAFSGLVVNVLIVAKSFTDDSALYRYQAVGISPFNLAENTYLEVVGKPKNESIGPAGQKGEDGKAITTTIESSNGSIFRIDQVDTTLFCRVYNNTTEITDTIASSRFQWKRVSEDPIDDERWSTSAKATGNKQVTITSEDCNGRTVFFCEVDLTALNLS